MNNELPQYNGTNQQQIVQTISEKLFAAADTRAVYGEPVTSGNYTLITASEVGSGGGGGSGGGFGMTPQKPEPEAKADKPESMAGGSGVGMGGGAFARPVAIIVIGSDGVEVKPVFDMTKIGIAFATTLGTMLLMLGRMRKAKQR